MRDESRLVNGAVNGAGGGLAGKLASALVAHGVHRNSVDDFLRRSQAVKLPVAVRDLMEDGHDALWIANALGEALSMPVFDSALVAIAETDDDWLLGEDGCLYMVNPLDERLRDTLMRRLGARILSWGVAPTARAQTITGGAHDLADEDASLDTAVDEIVKAALQARSSDIHLHPTTTAVRIRVRVDGRLTDMMRMEMGPRYLGIVNRILGRCGLPAGGYISPLDGQFIFDLGNRQIPIRVALLPVLIRGVVRPKVTMRLLNTDTTLKRLDRLGFPDSDWNPQLGRIRSITRRPNGLILVTGPTGSGKTTTLYAMLEKMVRENPDRAYYTLEDPQEIELAGVDQSQVNVKAGLTFERGLENLMRQDPDVILVGEIRNTETCNLAVRASLTGHLVLSTLHTNSGVDAVPRMIDMGCDPLRLADTLICVMAQRVVQRVCGECAVRLRWGDLATCDHFRLADAKPDLQERYRTAAQRYTKLRDVPEERDQIVLSGPGCPACDQRGYKGRTVITETLLLDDTLRDMVATNESTRAILRYAREHRDYRIMWEHAMTLIRSQVITLDEAEDVLGQPPLPAAPPSGVAHAETHGRLSSINHRP